MARPNLRTRLIAASTLLVITGLLTPVAAGAASLPPCPVPLMPGAWGQPACPFPGYATSIGVFPGPLQPAPKPAPTPTAPSYTGIPASTQVQQMQQNQAAWSQYTQAQTSTQYKADNALASQVANLK